jgi:hypothetical protein
MDRPLFGYGTLSDPDLLAGVLGRPLVAANILAAVAPGFRIAYYPGRVYPALLVAPGGRAEGLLLLDVTRFERDVLDIYEGAEYRRDIVSAIVDEELHEADAYLPTATVAGDAEPWSLGAWQASHKRAVLGAELAAAARIRADLIAALPN